MLAEKRRQPRHTARHIARHQNRPLQPNQPPVAATTARQAEQHSLLHVAVLGYN